MDKTYKLLAADGSTIISPAPGTLGGNSKAKIYGQLSCLAANRALAKGYARHRVFFADERAAIAAGYRPCGSCMRDQYKRWKAGGTPNTPNYPWLVSPA
ncbi:metal-binding protein [Desulfuromonas versatilis]|uniref:Metal-binding protein n=1 Tax=Desulfuromonas versatilis TaxID=2802975 RepID=A0ABM8HQK8_9BACT|nr:metal-binding protein [Desulfuromonas versatilis]